MANHHRLDHPSVQGGDAHTEKSEPNQSNVTNVGEAKLPETDFHDGQTEGNRFVYNVDRRPIGPYAGDDLVTQQEDQHIKAGHEAHVTGVETLHWTPPKPDPIDVIIVDSNKTTKTTHKVYSLSIPPSSTVAVGKDPTRILLYLKEITTNNKVAIVPQPVYDGTAGGITDVNGFLISGLIGPLMTEEAVYIYNSDQTNTAVVGVYAEFQRGIENREEWYSGDFQDSVH